jgi:hypothetical protein
MAHFFYVDKQPYGLCLRCTRSENLWIVADLLPGSELTGFLCNYCLTELATFAGFVIGEEHESTVNKLHQIIKEQEAQIEKIPNLLEGLTSNVNTLISDFVTDLASVTVSNIVVQSEDSEAVAGGTAKKPRRSSKSDSTTEVAAPAVDESVSE